ncbi:MAG: type II/IV secretion system ATPase subunit [Methanosarcinaceae archaeon]|nr:type II/IV secretion system ATPase subunit [Methanosarcinaceae archaeon]
MTRIIDIIKQRISAHIPTREQKPLFAYDPSNDGELVSFTPPEGLEEVERYWVDEPYSFISILFDRLEIETFYYVIEPRLNKFEKILLEDTQLILQDVLTLKGVEDLDTMDRSSVLREKTEEVLSEYSGVDARSFEKIFYYIKRDFVEYGEISPMMRDTYVEDIWCNGENIPIYVYHTAHGDIASDIMFQASDVLDSFVLRIAQQSGRNLSKSSPILDTVMREGSRINITFGKEISPKGTSFSIRRQKNTPFTPIDLVAWNTFSSEMMAYFWLCVENRKNILFCGGTASGKTSSLNAIGMFIPLNIRIVTLEDTREIRLPHKNWIPTVTRDSVSVGEVGKVDLEDLLRTSLRQRPEYLIVGEVRGRESQILFQAMNAGHSTCSTFHAGSATEVINRFTHPPINVPPAMFSALDVISIQTNAYDLGVEKRRAYMISEIVGVKQGVEIKDVFEWVPTNDTFIYHGSGVLSDIMNRRGWNPDELEHDLKCRSTFLKTMLDKGIRDYDSVARWINMYHKDPETTLSALISGMPEGMV